MRKPIPYGKQLISDEDIKSVVDVLNSDFITQGPVIEKFEDEFSKVIGSKYAIAVSSGTAALHLCALVLGVNAKSRVLTTPITFAASANCIKYCNGNIEFVDIDKTSYLIEPENIMLKIKSKPKGYYTGIIPVNLGGLSTNLEKINQIAKENNLWVIEDACHSPGSGFYNNDNTFINSGSCIYSDLSIFSFHPVKHIAAGEGGMITTNDEKLAKKIKLLRTHGITKEHLNKSNSKNPWYYEMVELGFNYRLSDIHAALGLSQLKKLKNNVDRRMSIARKYDYFFDMVGIKHQKVSKKFFNSYHLYIIEVEDRLELYNYLVKNGIYAQIHYIPLYRQPYYKNFNYNSSDYPNSEEYYSKCISLPIFPSLTVSEQDHVIQTISKFYNF